jgi:hypothetical protein
MDSATLIDAQLLVLQTVSTYLTIIALIIIGALLSYIAISFIREKDRRHRVNMSISDPHAVDRQKVFQISDEEIHRIYKKFYLDDQ